MKGVKFRKLDGSKLKIGVVVARWNDGVTSLLLAGCKEALRSSGVLADNIEVIEVPGAFELVYGADMLIGMKKLDAVLCLGTVIKGETPHDEYICQAVSQGIMQLNIKTKTPVIFGVLTSLSESQALARATENNPDGNNHGYFWGLTAVEMAILKKKAGKKKE